jgi:aerobic C4-dicarboxylate transport protein
MSEARAVTNFAGNAIATVLVATWTRELDREQLDAVLAGDRPFDETTMLDDGHGTVDAPHPADATNAGPGQRDAREHDADLAQRSIHEAPPGCVHPGGPPRGRGLRRIRSHGAEWTP